MIAKRNWTVFCSEIAGGVLHSLPDRVEGVMTLFLRDLARRGGAAIDAGLPPPGKPRDTKGIEWSVSVDDLDACVEYVVMADIKELYIEDIVWTG
ncbi:hypothetical protein [Actinomadura litoris]|uniref:Uncharacterized protein n=1 Tax=Actinomadura litoris TaxID=2678616 RepID=A0A7K1KVE9_9ACTN|nr:hypothetical protein [Actinomadura litoris]MUN36140.1 hypothetical protein [Actinomadura litoris]